MLRPWCGAVTLRDVAGDYGTLLTRLELADYNDDSETERVEAFPE